MIPLPHGGHLVDRRATEAERVRREGEQKDLLTLQPFIDSIYDAEKIGLGAYSPLEGFQDRATVESIVNTGRLPNGLPWTIPILLAPTGTHNLSVVSAAKPGDEIGLLDQHDRLFAILHLEEKSVYDKKRLAQGIYGTTDPAHPNVADLVTAGDTALAGRIDLLRRLDLPTGDLEWSPEETRAEFARRGWKNVVAYQTRNVPHTAHEYLQRCSLEREEVDGLFVHPVLGRLKKGDYRPEVTLEAYRVLLKNYYPADRVALASLTITMRYAGPNAALFLAIVRKNFGCNLYIVGRDQAGIGKYYEPYACQKIFDTHPIDVTPLRFLETFYCRVCGWMATPRTCAHSKEQHMDTSQTRIRDALSKGESLPKEIIRPEVAQVLARGDVLLTE
jgi:sulfate adenylyltransferase